ncbi:MAG: phage transcriptional regulator, RinA family [Firmicutes bacterium]|nr:phage transcriptional regulator, RinA family [Bacillota bacterium]
MKLRRDIKLYIEAELRDYHQTKQDLLEAKHDIILEGYTIDGSGIRGTNISRPTEAKTVQLITNKRIRRMQQVVDAIDKVLRMLPDEKYRLIELRYWQEKQGLNDEGIAQELNCDRRTVYRWVDGIMLAIAIEMGECHKGATIVGA